MEIISYQGCYPQFDWSSYELAIEIFCYDLTLNTCLKDSEHNLGARAKVDSGRQGTLPWLLVTGIGCVLQTQNVI